MFSFIDYLFNTLNSTICIKTDIPNELNEIDDELKAIYHSKDTVCFFILILKTRELRNEFIEKTKEMDKVSREQIYKEYSNKYIIQKK